MGLVRRRLGSGQIVKSAWLVYCLVAAILLSAPVSASAVTIYSAPVNTWIRINPSQYYPQPQKWTPYGWTVLKGVLLDGPDSFITVLRLSVEPGRKYTLEAKWPNDGKTAKISLRGVNPFVDWGDRLPKAPTYGALVREGVFNLGRDDGSCVMTNSRNVVISRQSQHNGLLVIYAAPQRGVPVEIRLRSPADPQPPKTCYIDVLCGKTKMWRASSRHICNSNEDIITLLNDPDGRAPQATRPWPGGGGTGTDGRQKPPPTSPPTASPPTTPPRADQPSSWLENGDFHDGLAHWRTGQYGYAASPKKVWAGRPDASSGCLRLSVYGGTQYADQVVRIGDLNQELTARFRVERWSTFNGGQPGGWAAVSVTFKDSAGRNLATTLFYLNPHAPSVNRKGVIWKRLNPALPLPTPWIPVRANLADLAREHGLSSDRVASVKIAAVAFGTHEDRKPTVVCFDDFHLAKSAGGESPGGSGRPALWLDRTTVAPGQTVTVHFKGAEGFAENAWIGIVPSGVPHGNERTNDDHDLAYQYLHGRVAGSLTFKAPVRPGSYDFRMHDTDDYGREMASVTFRVVSSGQGSPPHKPTTVRRNFDHWLGRFSVTAVTEGLCPGPGPNGEWLWSFEVVRRGKGYAAKIIEPEPVAVKELAFKGRMIRFVIDDRWQQEITLTLSDDGQNLFGKSFYRRPARSGDPCSKARHVGRRLAR